MGILVSLVASFGAGLFAPLGALCILPLYPGFLAYLAGQVSSDGGTKKSIFVTLGLIVTVGVITSMVLFGFIFTYLLQESLTEAIAVISPVAFGVLVVVSLFLLFDVKIGKLFPRVKTPKFKNPYINSFLFGLFFGAIVLPCNPASLIVLFALSTSVANFLANFFNFFLFGVGMSFPLLILALVSGAGSATVINFLVKHRRMINIVAGAIMLVISFYYLVFVFQIFGDIGQRKTVPLPANFETLSMEKKEEIKITADGTKYLVEPDKIVSGGPPKDGIPSIDNPKFVSVENADEWIEDNELVLAIKYKGEDRVYPLQIMVWHEVVNDKIAGDPILITYCPLCGSGIAYERKINGEEVEFGTSGKLYNSNLVMYDRKTDSYWTQIDGQAIVGELTGMELEPISMDTVVWRDWKKFHPDSLVLSQETGFDRLYGRDPYGSYYENDFLFFPVENRDDRIHPKTVVFGIEVNKIFKAYKEEDLKRLKIIEDTIGGVGIRLERSEAGVVKIISLDTEEEIIKERDFWFAWYAFHPETQVYQK